MTEQLHPDAQERCMAKSSLFSLPNLAGVKCLTRTEAKKDLREILRTLIREDSDSDSTVLSAEVLESSYPVKPRRTPRHPSHHTMTAYGVETRKKLSARDMVEIEESLQYLNDARISKTVAIEAENLREKLEMQCSKADSHQRDQEEAYMKLLQGLLIRTLRMQALHNRENDIVHDIYKTCQLRSEMAVEMKQETAKQLHAHKPPVLVSCAPSSRTTRSKDHTNASVVSHQEGDFPTPQQLLQLQQHQQMAADPPTAVLHVHLSGSAHEVVLHQSQRILTPMGLGKIQSIHPGSMRVVIQLSFGVMYSTIHRVAFWHANTPGGIDTASDSFLIQKWKMCQDEVNLSICKREDLRTLMMSVEEASVSAKQSDFKSSSPVKESLNNKNGSDIVCDVADIETNDNVTVLRREMLANALNCGHSDVSPHMSLQDLQLAFATPGDVEKVLNAAGSEDEGQGSAVWEYCGQSMQLSNWQTLNVGNHTCKGNLTMPLTVLRRSLKNLEEEVAQHDALHRKSVQQLEHVQSKAAGLMHHTCLRRLDMIGRQTRHRNALARLGLVATPAPSAEGDKSGAGGMPAPFQYVRPTSRSQANKQQQSQGQAPPVEDAKALLSVAVASMRSQNGNKSRASVSLSTSSRAPKREQAHEQVPVFVPVAKRGKAAPSSSSRKEVIVEDKNMDGSGDGDADSQKEDQNEGDKEEGASDDEELVSAAVIRKAKGGRRSSAASRSKKRRR